MRFLTPEDEKRLDEAKWLCGSFLRGVQVDVERRDVAVFAVGDFDLVELACEAVGYLALPNPFDTAELPRIVGLAIQPLPEAFVVRLEFSNHPAQIHLQCQRVVVRTTPLEKDRAT